MTEQRPTEPIPTVALRPMNVWTEVNPTCSHRCWVHVDADGVITAEEHDHEDSR